MELLPRALKSLLGQSCCDLEIIVVDDGSTGRNAQELHAMEQAMDSRIRVCWRHQAEPKHGPNIARNVGVTLAAGQYIGFLDDDDYWRDSDHLAIARRCLEYRSEVDLYISGQVASRGDNIVVADWLPYVTRIRSGRQVVMEPGVHALRTRDFLQPEGIGFAHVNMCIIRRDLLASVGGFWDEAPYEGDLNFFLRLMDRTQDVVYRYATVSVNTLRDVSSLSGVSSIPEESRLLFRMLACQHALLRCQRPEVRSYAKQLLAGTLKTLSKRSFTARKFEQASEFAAQAASIDLSPRWLSIAAFLKFRTLLSRESQQT